jgi:hypothetical protein
MTTGLPYAGETAAAKNELEAYIIRMRDDLSEDGGDELLKKVRQPSLIDF